jgi:folylpolyglutamate synthase/dihydropteroate synthase
MTLHKITEFYTEWFSVYPDITSKFAPSPYLKTVSNKIMIQTKLIDMFMISYYTKVHLSKCIGSWVVSTKQTMNFNIQTTAMFVFFVFDQTGHIKSC